MSTAKNRLLKAYRWKGKSKLERVSIVLKNLQLFSALFVVGYSLYGLAVPTSDSGYSSVVVIALLAFSTLCFCTAMAVDTKLRQREAQTAP